MATSYRKCQFINSDNNYECSVFYSSEEHEKYCILHRDIMSAEMAAQGFNKDSYINHRNEKAKYCYAMSLDELEKHISDIEKIIEIERVNYATARAVKTDRLEKLTDEERLERRKIKLDKVLIKDTKPKTVTAKNDPVKFMMQKFNINEIAARAMLGL